MDSPVFTAELDVPRGSSYGGFISGVRNQLVLHAGATRHLELVLLRRQEDDDPKKAPWFGVRLRPSSGNSVLLRIRADILYISGYQSSEGRWWEFRGGSVIGDATQIAFTDSYESMGRAASLALESVTLGKGELEAAAMKLAAAGANAAAAAAGGGSQKDTARSLMVIAVMISEAVRFRSIAGALAHIMCSGRLSRLPAHMVEQVKSWGSLSEYWLGAVLYGQRFLPLVVGADGGGSQLMRGEDDMAIPERLLAPARIECQDHAMMALGVVLNQQRPLQDRHKQALEKHWRAVRAQARKLDTERSF